MVKKGPYLLEVRFGLALVLEGVGRVNVGVGVESVDERANSFHRLP